VHVPKKPIEKLFDKAIDKGDELRVRHVDVVANFLQPRSRYRDDALDTMVFTTYSSISGVTTLPNKDVMKTCLLDMYTDCIRVMNNVICCSVDDFDAQLVA